MGLFSRSKPVSTSDDDRAAAVFRRGLQLFEEKRWAEAEQEFATAAELVPHSIQPRLYRGAALANSGRAAAGLELLRDCVREQPESAAAHNGLGMALGKLERFDEAAPHIVQAVILGHPQAAGTMRALSMDYCRDCHRPVYLATPSDAEISIVGPTIGMGCTACGTVFCSSCLMAGSGSVLAPPCPRCGGALAPLERENR